MISRDCFAWQVKRALASFHDPVGLQTNCLLELLASHPPPGQTAAACLRETLRQAIESLRPASSVPPSGPEWLGYRILWMRYVQSRSQYVIRDELGLSRTSFYRHHEAALNAVVGVLWEGYQKQTARPEPRATLTGEAADEQAVQEAVRLARSSRPQPVDPKNVLDGVMRVLAPLAGRQGLTVSIEAPLSLPMTYCDPGILRQVLLNLLTEGLKFATSGGLQLTAVSGDGEIIWQFRGLDRAMVTQKGLGEVTGCKVSRTLLESCGGRLWLECDAGGAATLSFAVPTVPAQTILVIDDDDDTVALYERYLRKAGYSLQHARGSKQVRELLAEVRPQLILLDVLMPGEDGWDILQYLRIMPETADIPVVVCSVLDQPDLALVLGAAQVLRKPISQTSLLQAVQTLLAREDSAG